MWNPYGLTAPAQAFKTIPDGLSNTILFAEVYANCFDRPRSAVYSWYYHDFGLTQSIAQGGLDGGSTPPDSYWDGMPNTWMFQIRPDPTLWKVCPNCCCPFFAQTGHAVLQVAMADGSVRVVDRSISQQTWNYAMQPADGQALGADW
jgi:hypothetical protein